MQVLDDVLDVFAAWTNDQIVRTAPRPQPQPNTR
jgi:hypothetical protein